MSNLILKTGQSDRQQYFLLDQDAYLEGGDGETWGTATNRLSHSSSCLHGQLVVVAKGRPEILYVYRIGSLEKGLFKIDFASIIVF